MIKFGKVIALAAALTLVGSGVASADFTMWFQGDSGQSSGAYSSMAAAMGMRDGQSGRAVTGVNPTVTLNPGEHAWLAVWGINDNPTAFITSLSHNIITSSAGVVNAANYSMLNPTATKDGSVFRWETSNATNNGMLHTDELILLGGAMPNQTANGIAVSGANGVKNDPTTSAADGFADLSDTSSIAYLLAVIELVGGNAGSAELRFQVGAGKITGAGTSVQGAVHFGWNGGGAGDPLVGDVNGGSTTNAISAIADANVRVVPEPMTLALLGLGGLTLVRRRKVA